MADVSFEFLVQLFQVVKGGAGQIVAGCGERLEHRLDKVFAGSIGEGGDAGEGVEGIR